VRVRDIECDRVPDVPVTVTVEAVDVWPDFEGEPPPPHPVSAPQASKTSSPILRRRVQMHPKAAANAANGTRGESTGLVFIPAFADVVIASVEMLVPVTLAGSNAQVVPTGRPEQDSATAPANPSSAMLFAASIPLPPRNVEYSGAVPVLLNFATNGLPSFGQEFPTETDEMSTD
jgi:hypothetical protein